MTPSAVLLRAAAQGLCIQADGSDLRVRGPRQAITDELLADIRAHKHQLLEALGNPRETAHQIWEEAVHEIGQRWDSLMAGVERVLWVDDLVLQEQIAEAIKSGDLHQSLRRVADWRARWTKAIDDATGHLAVEDLSQEQPGKNGGGEDSK